MNEAGAGVRWWSAVVATAGGFVVASVVLASTPWGGEDTGFIPPDAPKGPITKCEVKVGKAVGKLAAAILKCHAGRVTGKFPDESYEDNCELAARTKFGLTSTVGCQPCIDLSVIGASVEALVDSQNGIVYCDPAGTPFGGDNAGTIPSDAPKGPIAKCENGVGKNVGKLAAAIIKCHGARAAGKLADEGVEELCEGGALAKFMIKTNPTGCHPCTYPPTIGAVVEAIVDGSNNLVYCASPSGAFLDELR